jgi:hypothetical protein
MRSGMKKISLFLLAVVLVAGFLACSGGAGGGGDDDEPDQLNIQGSWSPTLTTPRGTGTFSLELTQNGNVMTGTLAGAPLAGNYYEYTINCILTLPQGTADFNGTINPEGTYMAGSVESSDGTKGTWNATRRQPRHTATAPIVHMASALLFSGAVQ